jgi:NHS family xanthosine MFS transporter
MNNIKLKLTILNFLEFFVFGAWLLSFGKYMGATLHFKGSEIGAVFMTLGFASLVMPGIFGIIADRFISPNKLFAILHLAGAVLLYFLAQQTDYNGVWIFTLLYLMLYMPSIGLDNTISYCILEKNNFDVVKTFPPIRVWGTVGFILAHWITDGFGWGITPNQFYFAAAASAVLGIYTFLLPDCPIDKTGEKKTLAQAFGIDALKLFADYKMAVFFFFAMLLGAALQITNMWGEAYLYDFGNVKEYADTIIVKYNGFVMTLSQISETLFIITIPFFLKRYGIKIVMLMSMFAWVLRFGLFGIGSPVGLGAVAIILSMIVYGMAFDFFNISGSLFVEQETDQKIRGSAQGLFIIMTNGLGAMIGAYGSGYIIDMFTKNGIKDWHSIWFVFAAYALIIAVLFAILFKYKHEPEKLTEIKH